MPRCPDTQHIHSHLPLLLCKIFTEMIKGKSMSSDNIFTIIMFFAKKKEMENISHHDIDI